MLLTVPVSLADKKFIPIVTKAFSYFPPGENHDLLIVGMDRASSLMAELERGIAPYFRSVNSQRVPNIEPLGWPREGNYLFQQATFIIRSSYAPNEAFLWFEMDCTPIEVDWLSTLQAAYHSDTEKAYSEGKSARRYMGVKQPTLETFNGEMVSAEEAGEHMMTCGIYPNDIVDTVKSINAAVDLGKPFSQHIQWYILPNLIDTPLIQNNWRTKNYRRGDESFIICDAEVVHPLGAKFDNLVTPDAVLVHGCKDGSLTEVATAGRQPIPPPARDSVKYSYPEEVFTPTPASYQPPGVPQFLQTPFAQHQQFIPAAPQTPPPPIQKLSFNDIEKPLNSFAVANEHSGDSFEAPVVTTRAQLGLIPQPQQIITEQTSSADDDLTPVVDELPEYNPPVLEQPSIPIPETPKPEPFISVAKRKKRGPGRPKKRALPALTDEERLRRSEHMKQIVAATKAKKLAALQAQQATANA